MKTIIAGTRNLTDLRYVPEAVKRSGFEISEVVYGCQRGIDTLARRWAEEQGIPTKPFPPDWDKFGRAAGPIRNRKMAEYSEALIAIWDGKSRGTSDMIRVAREKGLKVKVYTVRRG